LAFADLGPKVQVRSDDKNLSGFTIDLVAHLQKIHPQEKFTFVAGSDLREQLSQWQDSAKLRKMIDFEFLPRPPQPDSPFLPLSSSEVRRKLSAGEDPRGLLPEKVAQYVEKEGLYRN
jgi:nicotinate-nucleotide adenylyltransferase